MRLAPVPMFYAARPEEAIENSAVSCRTTHGAPQALGTRRDFCGLLAGALYGAGEEDLLSQRFSPVTGNWDANPLSHPTDQNDAVTTGPISGRFAGAFYGIEGIP